MDEIEFFDDETTEWTSVSSASGWVKAAAYITVGGQSGLAIRFRGGVTCFYPGTTLSDYEGITSDDSAGSWVHFFVYREPYIKI